MPHLTRFSVSGYRAIKGPLVFEDLGPQVALYGDNAVGKSSVLEALQLFGAAIAAADVELRGSGDPWALDAFRNAFKQDQWMFHHGCDEVVLAGDWASGHRLEVRFIAGATGVTIRFTQLVGNKEHLAIIQKHILARDDWRRRAEKSGPVEGPPPFISEQTQAQTALGDAVDDLRDDLAALLPIAAVASPSLPVPDATRTAFVVARASADGKQRSAMRRIVAEFGTIFPALGAGQLEPLLGTRPHLQDVAWVTEEGATVSLDHMGGGVQSVFGTLTNIAVAAARIVVVDEPEAFVGERAFDGVREALDATVPSLCDQVWIATHAVSLAGEQTTLFILERDANGTRARRAPRSELGRFTAEVAPPRPHSLGRISEDGAVRLPSVLIERLGLKPGDWVHYLDIGEKGARIVTEEELERALGETP